jgi:glycosyltransferase involved in cell wall biosynthesis
MQDYVQYKGQLNQSELFKQYHEHDLLLFPSLHDSSGNVILEAFAHSLPVICLKLGGPGVLVDDTCGRAIDTTGLSQDEVVLALADATTYVAEHPKILESLQLGARDRAANSTWDKVVEGVYSKVEQIYANEEFAISKN